MGGGVSGLGNLGGGKGSRGTGNPGGRGVTNSCHPSGGVDFFWNNPLVKTNLQP